MFTAAKDAMTSKAALLFLNKEIERYGRLTELKIDSKRKTVDMMCVLRGEAEPIAVRVDGYTIESAAGKLYAQATGFSCTRPWLEALLLDFGRSRRIELPPWASGVL